MRTLWIIEATCSKCGEQYNPESMHKDYIKHYECDAKPSKVWKYYLQNGQMVREEVKPVKRFTWRKSDLIALAVVSASIISVTWMFMTAWLG